MVKRENFAYTLLLPARAKLGKTMRQKQQTQRWWWCDKRVHVCIELVLGIWDLGNVWLGYY